jgi:PhzF family phenazine biosynthesis protein
MNRAGRDDSTGGEGMSALQFKQVDVFSDRPYFGNPVAVVLDADGVDEAQMQRIAAWTNLSETTFVCQPSTPEADYRLRIFSPAGELPFAGHPTLGSAHAVLESGFVASDRTALCQECAAGILPLRIEGTGDQRRIYVSVPTTKIRRECTAGGEAVGAVLGAPVMTDPAPLAIDVGPVWLVAAMDGRDAVRGLRPDMAAMAGLSRELNVMGVTVFSLVPDEDVAAHVRTFAPAAGIMEDPVCGSANATIAAYLAQTGLLARTGSAYAVSQGTEMGRDGRVLVRVDDGGRSIEIGGCAVTAIDGRIRI